MCAPRHWLTHGLRSLAWTIQIEFQSVFRRRQQCHKGYALFMQLKMSAPVLLRCKIDLNSWNKITQSPEQECKYQGDPTGKNGFCASNPSPADLLAPLICRSFLFKWAEFVVVNFLRHGDMSWLAPHMATLPSLRYRNMKDKASHHSDIPPITAVVCMVKVCPVTV